MKLRRLREHYFKRGGIWIAKKGFDSSKKCEEEGFDPFKWLAYQCTHCDKYHVSKINRMNWEK